MNTAYHSKYFANKLIHRSTSNDIEKLSMSLFDASVDINPHQVDAALFAFKSPLSKGVILADEVGLGKTIEAGLVLCQYWAERKRRLLVICPSSLRKQWSLELQEKFNLPSIILETKNYNEELRNGNANPFNQPCVIITSFNFPNKRKNDIRAIQWDLAVMDEAHKLRNVYRNSNRMGQGIKWAIEERKKLLLTATPLQNSLLELYGLSTLIDDHIFGDIKAFRSNYVNDGNFEDLRDRLKGFCKRTLRKDVLEYIKYTERHPITQPFTSSDKEQALYEAISIFLQREDTYSIPKSQRVLTTLILWKLLASSTNAVLQTLQTIKKRLEDIRDGMAEKELAFDDLVDEDELNLIEQSVDEIEENFEEEETLGSENHQLDLEKINQEIKEIERFIQKANEIQIDTKSEALLKALSIGFEKMRELGANKKALIFTESKRTQEYLKTFLEANGYKGKIVVFNGTNSDRESTEIYNQWVEKNQHSGRISGSKIADKRNALIEYFRDEAEIMIATESASEGVNLQFCSLIVNYDLPWNPQRIEQRIGRCHRYGQKFDVVVINFINQRNQADVRVYELLNEKFRLFEGILGSSDEVLGSIESGVDFERRILKIYQTCRQQEEIEMAFQELQAEMEDRIKQRMDKTKEKLLENFDIDVHDRLKFNLQFTKEHLNKYEKLFWNVTRSILQEEAQFDSSELSFCLEKSLDNRIPSGKYFMISKERKNVEGTYLYRLSHPLGEYVIDRALSVSTPPAKLVFDITNHPAKISVVQSLQGKQGYLILSKLTIESFEKGEHLLFSGFTSSGEILDQEQCEKLFQCNASILPISNIQDGFQQKIMREMKRYEEATISRVIEENNKYFREEQERLQKWADDLILASEKELEDVKRQIRDLTRKARLAISTEEQHDIQLKINELEKQKRTMRRKVFEVEDEVIEKRNELIQELESRMHQHTEREDLFIIEWEVV
ncbi:SNF2-related protein [Aneurinibacillus tyrosinisolvens]|uniref:SNF2-related protein n=1 Tax=Aneurinibacillus tyrosinisolvens TaxID=1443435 RepID=UPI00063EDF56|nr:SNF2-related protein [Aneurinibacillus tyrosinisolvens]